MTRHTKPYCACSVCMGDSSHKLERFSVQGFKLIYTSASKLSCSCSCNLNIAWCTHSKRGAVDRNNCIRSARSGGISRFQGITFSITLCQSSISGYCAWCHHLTSCSSLLATTKAQTQRIISVVCIKLLACCVYTDEPSHQISLPKSEDVLILPTQAMA